MKYWSLAKPSTVLSPTNNLNRAFMERRPEWTRTRGKMILQNQWKTPQNRLDGISCRNRVTSQAWRHLTNQFFASMETRSFSVFINFLKKMDEVCKSRWPIYWLKIFNWKCFFKQKPKKTCACTWYLKPINNGNNSRFPKSALYSFYSQHVLCMPPENSLSVEIKAVQFKQK